jgi:hypothetical protein
LKKSSASTSTEKKPVLLVRRITCGRASTRIVG